MSALEFTILGCGSSGGVPRIDGDWGACDPADPKNARTRCSLLVRRRGPDGVTSVIVDTSPDLRAHCLAAKVRHVDGVLITHDHADQTHGIDDLRAFAGRQRRRIPAWMDETSRGSLGVRFDYVFDGRGGYPAICDLKLMTADGERVRIDGAGGPVEALTFPQVHGAIGSVGLRFGDVAYSPDVNEIPEAGFAALQDLDVWVVDALRWTPHPTHAHVEKTLGWIDRVKPRRAILTNLHIDLDYTTLAVRLPSGVEPAFDGLSFNSPVTTHSISDNLP